MSRHQHPPLVSNQPVAKRRSLLGTALLLLAPMIVSAVAAYMVVSEMQPLYAAQSDVVFDPGDRPDILEKYLATQTVVVRSRAILVPISRDLNIPIETLEKNLSVDFPKGGVIMRLQYADPNSDTAFRVVRAVVDAFLSVAERMKFLGSSKYVLVQPFVLEEPVWPKPLQAAAVGAAVGLAISIAWLALVQLRRESAQA